MRKQKKPQTTYVTFGLPLDLIMSLKRIGGEYDVSYQSLMKIFLAEKVREEELAWKKLQS